MQWHLVYSYCSCKIFIHRLTGAATKIVLDRKYSTFPIVVIFFRGCVPEVVVPSYAVSFIYIPGKLGFVPLLCSLMMCANNRIQYCRWSYCLHTTLTHYHNYADLSDGILVLNACQVHSVANVCLGLSQKCLLSFVQYNGLCVISLPISLMMIVKIRVLYLIIIIESEVRHICPCLGLGNETMVCAVCLLIFLWVRVEWNEIKASIKPIM